MIFYFLKSWIMNLFEVKTNFQSADFWLINKHSLNKVGQPTRDYRPCLVGIKCNEDLVLPKFAFYFCLNLYQSRIWEKYANGSIDLVYLRVRDIRLVLNKSFSVQ